MRSILSCQLMLSQRQTVRVATLEARGWCKLRCALHPGQRSQQYAAGALPQPGAFLHAAALPTVIAMVTPKASCTPSDDAVGSKSNWRNAVSTKPAMRADRLEMALSCSARSSTSRLQGGRQGGRMRAPDSW